MAVVIDFTGLSAIYERGKTALNREVQKSKYLLLRYNLLNGVKIINDIITAGGETTK
jgi:hypothetical protein